MVCYFARNNSTGKHKNISTENYRVSQKSSTFVWFIKETVKIITVVNVCQVLFDSPYRESIEKNLFSPATITVSDKRFFFNQKRIKSRIGSDYLKGVPTNENKKDKKCFFIRIR